MKDIDYKTNPLEEAFSREVTLAYPTFMKSARRSNNKFVATEDIVQEALGEAWKYASVNGMPKTRSEFVKWGVHIIGWKILDSYKQTKKFEVELPNSKNSESFFDSAGCLSRKGYSSVVNDAIYNELFDSFSDRLVELYYSTNPVGAIIPYVLDGANTKEITSKTGYSPKYITRAQITLDRIVSEVINT